MPQDGDSTVIPPPGVRRSNETSDLMDAITEDEIRSFLPSRVSVSPSMHPLSLAALNETPKLTRDELLTIQPSEDDDIEEAFRQHTISLYLFQHRFNAALSECVPSPFDVTRLIRMCTDLLDDVRQQTATVESRVRKIQQLDSFTRRENVIIHADLERLSTQVQKMRESLHARRALQFSMAIEQDALKTKLREEVLSSETLRLAIAEKNTQINRLKQHVATIARELVMCAERANSNACETPTSTPPSTTSCTICYDNAPSILFQPCCHAITCLPCAARYLEAHTEQLKNPTGFVVSGFYRCPKCRSPILDARHIFW